MAAVLSCGPSAALSHRSAADLWGIAPHDPAAPIEVIVPANAGHRQPGIVAHRGERETTAATASRSRRPRARW
jgi:hypothetical protein